VAVVFMITSIGLAYIYSHRTGASVMRETRPLKTAPAPTPTPVEKGTPIQPAPLQPLPPASK
jgi:preprotein translocase subunit SecG